jgi:MerR family mercuric resistance operon transcriptional regulator
MAMHIGELARSAGVNVQTIRFYERQALLPTPMRNSSGYRSYDRSDLERVTFIKRNQELGFTLIEIKQLIQLHGSMSSRPKDLRRKPSEVLAIISLGRERLQVIDEKVRMLRLMRKQLASVVQQLETMSAMTCPVSSPGKRQGKRFPQKPASPHTEPAPKTICPVAILPRAQSKKPVPNGLKNSS